MFWEFSYSNVSKEQDDRGQQINICWDWEVYFFRSITMQPGESVYFQIYSRSNGVTPHFSLKMQS